VDPRESVNPREVAGGASPGNPPAGAPLPPCPEFSDLQTVDLLACFAAPRQGAHSRFTIITTTPNELCAELHNRMPVVLKPQPAWLGEQPADAPQLKALLALYPSDEIICWPVSARVGNVRNNDPSLIEPVAAA
jgi:hypothetical protein